MARWVVVQFHIIPSFAQDDKQIVPLAPGGYVACRAGREVNRLHQLSYDALHSTLSVQSASHATVREMPLKETHYFLGRGREYLDG